MAALTLTEDGFQRIARAVSDPNRLQMMKVIFAQPAVTCGCVAEALPIAAATVSHHLKELELAELIRVEKCGRFRRLSPRREVWKAYLAVLKEI
jgi:ArsR family transcriptional regulator